MPKENILMHLTRDSSSNTYTGQMGSLSEVSRVKFNGEWRQSNGQSTPDLSGQKEGTVLLHLLSFLEEGNSYFYVKSLDFQILATNLKMFLNTMPAKQNRFSDYTLLHCLV